MKVTKNLLLYFILGFGVLGLVLSYLLAVDYYGSSAIAESLCSALSSEGSCAKVKSSSYSAVPFPVLGNIPIALFGFTFYGLVVGLAYLSSRESEDRLHISILFFLILIAILVDVGLFIISLTIIKAVCSLCFLTYIVSFALFGFTYVHININLKENPFAMIKTYISKSLSKNFFNYLLIAIGTFSCGIWLSKPSGSKSNTIATSQDIIQAKIAEYEKAPVVNIDLTNIPFAGDEKAPIVIVKFADFNCGHCMHASHILDGVLAEFTGLVKVYYKNFPLDGNCNRLVQRKTPDASSCLAASFALCANKQKKFLPAYHALYKDNELGIRHSPSSIAKITQEIGLNLSTIQACMSSSEIASLIEKDVNEGDKLNIQSTPSIFINSKPLEPGTPEPNFLRELIKHISKKL